MARKAPFARRSGTTARRRSSLAWQYRLSALRRVPITQNMSTAPLAAYRRAVERKLRTGDASEHTHRSALETLLESLETGVLAINEAKRIECGAPDFTVARETQHGPLTIGWIEAKDVGSRLADIERDSQRANPGTREGQQLRRYLDAQPNLILTDYLEFRWYVEGKLRATARLATPDARDHLVSHRGGSEAVLALLADFLKHRLEAVGSPRELAERMARLTHLVHDVIVGAFETDNASDMLRDLRQAFAEVLIPDLPVEQFADMFAQTLAYGLFAARVEHEPVRGRFRRLAAAAEIPKTNPFLRRLFATITGPDLDDEPYGGLVDDLTQLLADTDMEAVLAGFGKRTGQEDPVVHFYETFLAAYDPTEREMRGVYYTPEPVVSYIVRSVDHLLRTRFGLPDGLADSSRIEGELRRAQGAARDQQAHRVLVLDPACGTGTFLYFVIDLIRERFREEGNQGQWSAYVGQHLLPRLFGFELLMAPYAVAHLKLGMQLAALDLPEARRQGWRYDFAGDERLSIYLTNSLEEAIRRSELLMGGYISDEANAAAEIKRDLPIMVVLGNPPYSGHSANASWRRVQDVRSGRWRRERTWIGEKLRDYYQVDGAPLAERNSKWLQDDYVKFICFGQWRIEQTGAGVLAFITNHAYLDNPTFRGMSQQLMRSFTDIYVLNLHGNERRKEESPDGGCDKNVFDIQQGVAIAIFVKENRQSAPARVHQSDLWGERVQKYAWLAERDIETTDWSRITPTAPLYLFVPQDVEALHEYQRGWKITQAMPTHVLGFQTHRDHFAVAFEMDELRARISSLRNTAYSDQEIREIFRLRDNRDWQLAEARAALQADNFWEEHFRMSLYRPLDWCACYFSTVAMDYPRTELTNHVAGRENLCMLVPRQIAGGPWQHAAVTSEVAESCVVSSRTKEQNYAFPVYVYPVKTRGEHDQKKLAELIEASAPKEGREPNFASEFVADCEKRTGLTFVPDGEGDLETTFGPENLFQYIYSVLHSPTYRDRYAEFLRRDFPRIPLTRDLTLFRALVGLGAELVALHLMESPALAEPGVHYPQVGPNEVSKGHPRYVGPDDPDPTTGEPLAGGRVYISRDDRKTERRGQYFEGVPRDIWEFQIGGYQVCEKWLKDRRGRVLSYEDQQHYKRIVLAISETIPLMAGIDAAIPGWPLQ